MRHAYVTKRVAPQGYVAVTRKLAHMLYCQGVPVTVCGSNVNCFHVFNGWYLGYTLPYRGNDYDFDTMVNSYVFHSDTELLRFPVFYVRRRYVTWFNKNKVKETKHA
jgi:hypothetical protein